MMLKEEKTFLSEEWNKDIKYEKADKLDKSPF